ncbi:MAG: hypothetical protein AB8C84_02250 [Oligoflexales bacterium]
MKICACSVLTIVLTGCLPKDSKVTAFEQPESIKGTYSDHAWEFSLPALDADIGAYEPNDSFQISPFVSSSQDHVKIQCLLKSESQQKNKWFFNFFAYEKDQIIFYKSYALQNCRSLKVKLSDDFSFDHIGFKVSWNEGRQNYVVYQGQSHSLTDTVLSRVLLDKKMERHMSQVICHDEGFYYGKQCQSQWFSLKVRRTQLCLWKNLNKMKTSLIQDSCGDESAQFQLRRRQQEGYTLQERSSYQCLTRSDQGWEFKPCYVFTKEINSDLARKQLFLVNEVPGNGLQLELLGERKQCVGLSSGVTENGAEIQKVTCIKDLGQWFDIL